MKFLNSLNIGRVLVIAGFIVTLDSVNSTFRHLGNTNFTFVASGIYGGTHAWHHLFREAIADIAAMSCVLVMLFGSAEYRNPLVWWSLLVLAVGHYSGYWIGIPINPGFAAPAAAEFSHISQAVLVILGLILAKPYYFATPVADTATA